MSSSWDTAEIELETETVHPEVKMDQEDIWDHLKEKKWYNSKYEDYENYDFQKLWFSLILDTENLFSEGDGKCNISPRN